MRIGAKYLLSIAADLNNQQILHDKDRITTHFALINHKFRETEKKENNEAQANPLIKESEKLSEKDNSSMNIPEKQNLAKIFPFLFQKTNKDDRY